jgi:hypothetical protein
MQKSDESKKSFISIATNSIVVPRIYILIDNGKELLVRSFLFVFN